MRQGCLSLFSHSFLISRLQSHILPILPLKTIALIILNLIIQISLCVCVILFMFIITCFYRINLLHFCSSSFLFIFESNKSKLSITFTSSTSIASSFSILIDMTFGFWTFNIIPVFTFIISLSKTSLLSANKVVSAYHKLLCNLIAAITSYNYVILIIISPVEIELSWGNKYTLLSHSLPNLNHSVSSNSIPTVASCLKERFPQTNN